MVKYNSKISPVSLTFLSCVFPLAFYPGVFPRGVLLGYRISWGLVFASRPGYFLID